MMMGRPLRIDWSREDTPEALKAAYRSERDILDCMDCGWSGRDGSSVRRQERWESTTGRCRHGWAGIEKVVWREYCRTRWEAGANRAF